MKSLSYRNDGILHHLFGTHLSHTPDHNFFLFFYRIVHVFSLGSETYGLVGLAGSEIGVVNKNEVSRLHAKYIRIYDSS